MGEYERQTYPHYYAKCKEVRGINAQQHFKEVIKRVLGSQVKQYFSERYVDPLSYRGGHSVKKFWVKR